MSKNYPVLVTNHYHKFAAITGSDEIKFWSQILVMDLVSDMRDVSELPAINVTFDETTTIVKFGLDEEEGFVHRDAMCQLSISAISSAFHYSVN